MKQMACRGKCEANQTISRRIIRDGFADHRRAHTGPRRPVHVHADHHGNESHLGDAERSNAPTEPARGEEKTGENHRGGPGREEGLRRGAPGARIHGAL